jgi:hypothetical protein
LLSSRHILDVMRIDHIPYAGNVASPAVVLIAAADQALEHGVVHLRAGHVARVDGIAAHPDLGKRVAMVLPRLDVVCGRLVCNWVSFVYWSGCGSCTSTLGGNEGGEAES